MLICHVKRNPCHWSYKKDIPCLWSYKKGPHSNLSCKRNVMSLVIQKGPYFNVIKGSNVNLSYKMETCYYHVKRDPCHWLHKNI